jgi:hypothetical protein
MKKYAVLSFFVQNYTLNATGALQFQLLYKIVKIGSAYQIGKFQGFLVHLLSLLSSIAI